MTRPKLAASWRYALIEQMPKTLIMKKRIDDLKRKLEECQADIDSVNLNDEEKYKRKCEKLENLNRDIRTLYLNKLYLDCCVNETIEVPADQLVQEVKDLEKTSKQLLSEFNLLSGRMKKEERIKYSMQKTLQELPFNMTVKKIQIQDLEAILERAKEELASLKDNTGIENEELLNDMLETCEQKKFMEGKEEYFRDKYELDSCNQVYHKRELKACSASHCP